MIKYSFLVLLLLFMGQFAFAQPGGDVAFGISTFSATSSNNAGSDFTPQTIGGGTFPGFSADFHLFRSLGVGGEVWWRATRNQYQGVVPFRPIFWDFNAVYSPLSLHKAVPQVWAGIGGESTRFYTGQINCGITSCTNFQSVNHFLADVGGGLKIYPKGNVFIRPEASWYYIRNNNEFSGPWAARYGVSLGYSFGGR